jgi:outer membrane biosynthesis protein TonB
MPTSEVPTNVNENEPGGVPDPESGSEPAQPRQAESRPDSGSDQDLEAGDSQSPRLRGSRWVDYDTHELLEMISELEDDRRWARLREGIWLAVLFHILLISAITWIPKYVFKVPQVIDPIDATQKRKDLTYLDSVPDAIRELQKPKVVAPPPKQTTVDKKTMEALNRPVPPLPAPAPPTPQPAVQPAPPAAVNPEPAPIPPTQASQSPVEAPRPAAVPARPSFAMNSDNPADQLKEAMRNAERNHGAGSESGSVGSGTGMARHPGASGGVEILSPTNGVDFRAWLERWHHETQSTWDPLIPDEVNPPILKSGTVVIRFRVLPNGRLMEPNGVILEGRSGDTALDRAAWGALTGSNYPPLPRDFHGPYLELRAYFLYNMQPAK